MLSRVCSIFSVSKIIARQLDLWIHCEFELLFLEAKALQDRLTKSKSKHEANEFKLFDKNMETGKVSNALRCLTEESKGGVLPINQKLGTKLVMDILVEKHPAPQTAKLDYVVKDPNLNTLPYHHSIFDRTNASEIRRSAMKTHGSHGPSGLDANEWRRILTAFKSTSNDICKSLAKLTILIATHELCFLDAYNSSRLIPLDKCPKCPGVRPIGVGEVMRRIIGRAIVT